MKKRFLALGMAAVTAMSSVMTCTAQTAESVSISAAFTSNSGDEDVKGNFDVTYTFHNATKDASKNWNNFTLEIFDGEGQFLTLRADAYGWTAGSWTAGGDAWDDAGNKHPTFTGQPEDWTVWAEDMKNADVEINVKRTDNIFKVNYIIEGPSDNTYYISTDVTLEGAVADDLMIHLTGEQVDLSNIKFIENKDSEATGTDPEQTPTDPEQTPTDPEQTPTDPEQTPTDPEQTATDVITSEDGDNIQVEYNKNQFEDKVKLTTKLLDAEDEDYKKINLKDFVKDGADVPENIPFAAYNISLLDMQNQTVQPNGKVTVKIACPEGYDNASSKVYRINDNGSLTNMLAVLKDGYLSFETNHFSTYVITAEDLFAGQGFVYGDVNGDGEINTKDAVMIKRYLAEFSDAKEGLDEGASDVTGDGKVSSADAVKLLQALAGKDVELGR